MDVKSGEARMPLAADWMPPALDLKRQLALFRRRQQLFFRISAGTFALAALVIFAIPSQYRAVAEVMIDQRPERVVNLQQVLPDLPADTSVVDTEVEVLKSRTLAEKTVDALGLDRDPEFNRGLRSKGSPRWLSGWATRSTRTGREEATDALLQRRTVDRVGFTAVIAISVRSRSPEKAAKIANVIADLYLRQQLDAKTAAAHRASDWLSARLVGLRADVETADHAVERYKSAHGLMTLTDAKGATITEEEISNLDAQLAVANGARAEADARLSAAEARIASGGQGDDLGEVLGSPVVQELRKQRDQVAKDIADLQGRYGPRHPEMLKAERQKTELDGQIQQEIARVISNLRLQAKVARSRSEAIATAREKASAVLAQSNAASVGLKELERNLDSVRTLYQSFLDRFKQTSSQDGIAQSDARIVSPAKAPSSPDFPRRPALLAAALTGSLMLGLVALWIAEAREDGLYAVEDVEQRLALRCLGLVPSATVTERGGDQAAPADIILDDPLSAFAEAFRAIRAGLLTRKTAGPMRMLAVTSALPGEGKTTACPCLGRVMARGGASVVVVDCDVRRRTMNQLLAEPIRTGLLEVLSGAADLDQALVSDAAGLFILPLGDEQQAGENLLDSFAMDRLLDALRRRFRVVLLDTAPVLLVTETRTLAAQADGVLFLARWRTTPGDAAASAVRTLQEAGAHIVGAALTQVDPRHMERRAYGEMVNDYPFYRGAEGAPRAFLP